MPPFLLLAALASPLVLADPLLVQTNDVETECFDLLQQTEKISSEYPKRIAHGIHSLTLADLRTYFNPSANSSNYIPTVNRNLSSSSAPILNDAPDLKRSGSFKTIGLQVAEEVVLSQ